MPELVASEGQTLRAQSKKAKQQGQAQSRTDNARNSNREVIKPVLANPLTVPWPALPKHLQTAAFHALKQLIPDDIPAYHTSRDRCHKKDRRHVRSLKAREEVRQKREAKGVLFKAAALASGEGKGTDEGDQAVEGDKGEGRAAVGDKRSLPVSSDAGVPANKKQKTALAAAASASAIADGRKDAATSSKSAVAPLGAGTKGSSDRHGHPLNTQTPTTRAEPPASLQHLVFGINETVKALERQTDGLRVRIMQLGEALEAHDRGVKKGGAGGAVRGDNAAVAVRKQMGKGGAQGSSGAVDKQTEKESAQAASGAEGAAAQQSTTAVQSDEELAGQPSPSQHLIPIPAPATIAATAPVPKQKPIEYILLPLPDLNPQTLAAHIPPYCATHNTLVYQYKHLIKVAKARLQRWEWDEVCEVMGVGVGAEGEKPAGQEDELNEVEKSNTVDKVDEVDEVRVVPLGRVQAELSGLVGLRRVACVGVRASHPDVTTLRALLPKSALKPPRYSLTLPFPIPTSRLQVHSDLAATATAATGPATATPTATARAAPSSSTHTPAARSKKRELVPTAPSAKHASTPGPTIEAKAQAVPTLTPHIHYAPLHVKGLTTTVPADGTARKAKRMEEVRKRRRERKEMKRVM